MTKEEREQWQSEFTEYLNMVFGKHRSAVFPDSDVRDISLQLCGDMSPAEAIQKYKQIKSDYKSVLDAFQHIADGNTRVSPSGRTYKYGQDDLDDYGSIYDVARQKGDHT